MDMRKVAALWPRWLRSTYHDPIRVAVSVRAAYAFGDWPPTLVRLSQAIPGESVDEGADGLAAFDGLID